jgi:hypothetical protein
VLAIGHVLIRPVEKREHSFKSEVKDILFKPFIMLGMSHPVIIE